MSQHDDISMGDAIDGFDSLLRKEQKVRSTMGIHAEANPQNLKRGENVVGFDLSNRASGEAGVFWGYEDGLCQVKTKGNSLSAYRCVRKYIPRNDVVQVEDNGFFEFLYETEIPNSLRQELENRLFRKGHSVWLSKDFREEEMREFEKFKLGQIGNMYIYSKLPSKLASPYLLHVADFLQLEASRHFHGSDLDVLYNDENMSTAIFWVSFWETKRGYAGMSISVFGDMYRLDNIHAYIATFGSSTALVETDKFSGCDVNYTRTVRSGSGSRQISISIVNQHVKGAIFHSLPFLHDFAYSWRCRTIVLFASGAAVINWSNNGFDSLALLTALGIIREDFEMYAEYIHDLVEKLERCRHEPQDNTLMMMIVQKKFAGFDLGDDIYGSCDRFGASFRRGVVTNLDLGMTAEFSGVQVQHVTKAIKIVDNKICIPIKVLKVSACSPDQNSVEFNDHYPFVVSASLKLNLHNLLKMLHLEASHGSVIVEAGDGRAIPIAPGNESSIEDLFLTYSISAMTVSLASNAPLRKRELSNSEKSIGSPKKARTTDKEE